MLNLEGYQDASLLYQGSRTLVYRASRSRDRQSVIVKVLRNPHPSVNELIQFHNQYVLTQTLDHSAIVTPLALERYTNGYALVLPDTGMVSLAADWPQTERSLTEFLDVALQLTQSLHYLNGQQILHKDIKPANILIHPTTRRLKLIDFSIASLLPREQQQLANPNRLEGTLAYISPEQTGRMNRGIDYRTDFYSLGVTLYELLTGLLPFEGDDPMALIHCHIAQTCLSPQIFPDPQGKPYPQTVAEIILKLMAKNPEERYQSALGLQHDLEQCQQQLEAKGEIPPFTLGTRDVCDRFLIPEKLYGREAEVETLLQAFARVSEKSEVGSWKSETETKAELVLVAGFSGIGKTAVINEIHKPIVRQRGYFVQGKFDQFNRTVPFSGVVQALRDLIGQLQQASNAEVARWRSQILAAVGEKGQVLLEVLPELARIIGEQPPVPDLSGQAAQNRFNLLLGKFLELFATPEHPLVIFLDDLQWADSASLNLLTVLLDKLAAASLLVVGAYRDNEVFPAHPLLLTLRDIEQQGTTLNTLTLTPLQADDVTALIADTLHCVPAAARPLTQLIMPKTQGNPFFTTQFLQGLYAEGLFSFDRAVGHWQCDLSQVQELALTDDVVAFMVRRLQALPMATQTVLKHAACLGNHFDLQVLALICETSPATIAQDLWQSLQAGFVLPQSETYKFFQGESGSTSTPAQLSTGDRTNASPVQSLELTYRFLHDRVQQAAYALIPDAEKPQTHYRLGRLLLAQLDPEDRAAHIFELVGQLNQGIDLISAPEERQELAQLNLLASRKARSGTAYQATLDYATLSLQLLGEMAWQQDYARTLELHELGAEAAAILGEFGIMEDWIETVLAQTITPLERITVSVIRMQALTGQSRFLEAIAWGQTLLAELGVALPEAVTPDYLHGAIATLQAQMGEQTLDTLLELPAMTDPQQLAIMQIAGRLIPACYLASSPLFPVLAILQVQRSLTYGNAPTSSTGYADYGMFMLNFQQDIATSNQFGQLAYQLAAAAPDPTIRAITFVPVGFYLYHHQQALRETLPIFRQGYEAAIDVGKFDYVGHHIQGFCTNAFWSGQPLRALELQIRDYQQILAQFKLSMSQVYCDIIAQTVQTFLNSDSVSPLFTRTDEDKWREETIAARGMTQLFYFYLHRAMVQFFQGEYLLAQNDIEHAQKFLEGGIAMTCEAGLYFYHSLISLALAAGDSNVAVDHQQITQNQTQLKARADHAPMNYHHKWALVEAEKCRVLDQKLAAIEWYEQAIAGAKEHQYLQDEALANERAALFYLAWDKTQIAATYLQQAYNCYAQWGAKAKTAQLTTQYPHLLQPILQPIPTEIQTQTTSASSRSLDTITTNTALLDLTSAIKAAQVISGEIELDALLVQLMAIVLENAGADQGALALHNNDDWEIVVQVQQEQVKRCAIALDQAETVPKTILNTVKQTQKSVLIHELARNTQFMGDPYFQTHQPQSICCLPMLNQGQLIGLIYLENQLTTHVFTENRVEILNLLTTQAAISIEKARLYRRLEDYSHTLESQVEQRTQELQQNNQQLQHTLQNLQRTQAKLLQAEKMSSLGQMVAGITHEINNPINFITGNLKHARQYFQDLLALVDLYEQEFPKTSAAIVNQRVEMELDFLRDDLSELLTSMQTGSDRIYQIILGLRNFSRLDEAQQKRVDIHEGLDNTLMMINHHLRGDRQTSEITVQKQYGQLPLINCYPSQLNQVFLQLFNNAIDALRLADFEVEPRLIIKTQKGSNQHIEIVITDNGLGMDENAQNRMFDPFFTTKPVGQGTGLGMAIVHQIITEQHQGTIRCTSTQGQGTEFVIGLPLS
ncbi:MAG: AAA family ATPase [Spirulina sp. SIO3F2]|nr:AAA family ATPase [Spirulina sp. SIO3F2]